VFEELASPAHVVVVALLGSISEMAHEAEVNDRRGMLLAKHVLETPLADVDLVERKSRRTELPAIAIDTDHLSTLEEPSRDQPPLPSGHSDYENLLHLALLVVKPEGGAVVILVPDLIDGLLSFPSGEQTVRTVDDHPIGVSDVLVGVHDTLRNEDEARGGLSGVEAIAG
jgi:hypothetical protein